MYVGSSQARAILRQYEFFFPQSSSKKSKDKGKKKTGESKQDRVKFDVLLTSYEMINLDTAILKALKWECLVTALLFFCLKLKCVKVLIAGFSNTICLLYDYYLLRFVLLLSDCWWRPSFEKQRFEAFSNSHDFLYTSPGVAHRNTSTSACVPFKRVHFVYETWICTRFWQMLILCCRTILMSFLCLCIFWMLARYVSQFVYYCTCDLKCSICVRNLLFELNRVPYPHRSFQV